MESGQGYFLEQDLGKRTRGVEGSKLFYPLKVLGLLPIRLLFLRPEGVKLAVVISQLFPKLVGFTRICIPEVSHLGPLWIFGFPNRDLIGELVDFFSTFEAKGPKGRIAIRGRIYRIGRGQIRGFPGFTRKIGKGGSIPVFFLDA